MVNMNSEPQEVYSNLNERAVQWTETNAYNSEQVVQSNLESSTPDSAVPRRKTGRTGKPKTRSGCVTCKIRRIKCDEGKPHCKRCVVTGRECDGYQQVSRSKAESSYAMRTAELRPTMPALQLQLVITFNHHVSLEHPEHIQTSEHRSLEYFRCRTATILSSWLVENLWKHQIPQTAQTEPAIRNAVIALAKLHESAEMYRVTPPGDPRLSVDSISLRLIEARHHYDTAISDLARALRERSDCEEVALMCCVLFTIYNFVSGNFAASFFHLHNGIEILNRWQATKIQGRVINEDSLEQNLITVLNTLSFNSNWYNHQHPLQEPDVAPSPAFSSLDAAGVAMQCLTAEILRVVRIITVLTHNSQTRWEDQDGQYEALLARLAQWLDKFNTLVALQYPNSLPLDHTSNAFIVRPTSPYSIADDLAIDELRAMHHALHVWLWIVAPASHAPEHTPMLEQFVSLVEELYSKWLVGPGKHSADTHVFDMAVIPPLNAIAWKSRSDLLSMRAENLLKNLVPLLVSARRYINGDRPIEAMSTKLDTVMADSMEQGNIEMDVEPATRTLGLLISIRPDGQGWEVRQNLPR